ncbi:MAG: DNA alkylation repair protein, partial [Clostridia bacterium]
EQIKDFNSCVLAIDVFLPFINNWATCDILSPKVFKKHLPLLFIKIKEWINSENTYTVRFGIKMLMNFFLDENFDISHLKLVKNIDTDEYYINMMIAWYFATALAKQYDKTLPYLEQHYLSDFTHNKTIQKAIESYRISSDKKAYLKTLKVIK